MRKALVAAATVLAQVPAWASPACERPEDAAAIHTAALQQELMVAAFLCHDIPAYNDFVLSHRSALQDSDRALMALITGITLRISSSIGVTSEYGRVDSPPTSIISAPSSARRSACVMATSCG